MYQMLRNLLHCDICWLQEGDYITGRALACTDLHVRIDFSNGDIEISEDEGSALLWGRVKIIRFFEPVRLSAARQSAW